MRGAGYFISILLALLSLSLFVQNASAQNMSAHVTQYSPSAARYCASLLPAKYNVDFDGKIYDEHMVLLDVTCDSILKAAPILFGSNANSPTNASMGAINETNSTLIIPDQSTSTNQLEQLNVTGQVPPPPLNEDVRRDCANLLRDNYYVDLDGKIYAENLMPLNKDCVDVFNGNVDPNLLKSTQNEEAQIEQSPPRQNWLATCKDVEWGLMNRCDVYVNPDGSLSAEGRRAYQCISNGGILSAAGLILNLPANIIIGILEALSERTNCGNIVNWEILKTASNPMEFLNQLKK